MKFKFFLLLALVPLVLIGKSTNKDKSKDKVIIDCSYTFEEAIKGTKAPQDVIDQLCLLEVEYISLDGKHHRGQLVVNKELKDEVKTVFDMMLKDKFPIKKVIPIVKYNWSDDASMADNNSSSFCYRTIAGTNRPSQHALGRAVDINPLFNPVVEGAIITPKAGKYDIKRPGTLLADGAYVKKFIEMGWRWGGNFNDYKDYHHFDKKNV